MAPPDLDPAPVETPPVPTTWTMADRYSGATLTFESDGEGTCHVKIAYNNDDVVTLALTIEMTDADVADLGTAFVIPVIEHAEQDDAAARILAADRAEAMQAEERLRPFVLITKGTDAGILHRAGCSVMRSAVAGLHRLEHADRTIDQVRILLNKIVTDPEIIRQRTHRFSDYSRNRIVPTLKFCGTCKPLGDASNAISLQVAALANTSVADRTESTRLATLRERIEALIWEVSREHIDNLEDRS